jgi:hypothetical protein
MQFARKLRVHMPERLLETTSDSVAEDQWYDSLSFFDREKIEPEGLKMIDGLKRYIVFNIARQLICSILAQRGLSPHIFNDQLAVDNLKITRRGLSSIRIDTNAWFLRLLSIPTNIQLEKFLHHYQISMDITYDGRSEGSHDIVICINSECPINISGEVEFQVHADALAESIMSFRRGIGSLVSIETIREDMLSLQTDLCTVLNHHIFNNYAIPRRILSSLVPPNLSRAQSPQYISEVPNQSALRSYPRSFSVGEIVSKLLKQNSWKDKSLYRIVPRELEVKQLFVSLILVDCGVLDKLTFSDFNNLSELLIRLCEPNYREIPKYPEFGDLQLSRPENDHYYKIIAHLKDFLKSSNFQEHFLGRGGILPDSLYEVFEYSRIVGSFTEFALCLASIPLYKLREFRNLTYYRENPPAEAGEEPKRELVTYTLSMTTENMIKQLKEHMERIPLWSKHSTKIWAKFFPSGAIAAQNRQVMAHKSVVLAQESISQAPLGEDESTQGQNVQYFEDTF